MQYISDFFSLVRPNGSYFSFHDNTKSKHYLSQTEEGCLIRGGRTLYSTTSSIYNVASFSLNFMKSKLQ